MIANFTVYLGKLTHSCWIANIGIGHQFDESNGRRGL